MSSTGHDDFDQLKEAFSATIRDIESALHKRAAASSNVANTNKITSESIREASSILEKMSSIVKNLSETKQPALKQELVDIYKACKMQLKTYKLLNKQTDLFQNTKATSTTSSEMSVTEERSILFGTSATTNGGVDDSSKYNKTDRSASGPKNVRDEITSNTKGRLRAQNSRLQDAIRSIRETDEIAQEISGELAGQRETLETTGGRMQQFSSMTEHSKNLLNSMNKPWWRKW